MVTLLSEIHFWTSDDHILVKDLDYGAFKYQDRKENIQNIIHQSKKEYAEKRDYLWNLPNKRPNKLKEKLKELEDQIHYNKIVYCKWIDNSVLRIIINNGLIINIGINVQTGDIQKISFDKYLIGKLLSEYVTDILITRTHLLCTYNDNQSTVLHFNKPLLGTNPFEKLTKLDPKISTCELSGPPGRKLDRTISCNLTGDLILIWWRCLRDEVYPWSPVVKDQDRSNIHVYHLMGAKLELICFRRTESEPVNISFSKVQQNIIHCVEQKVSRKGEVTVETCTFEIVRNRLHPLLTTSIPLQTQVCCHSFSPDNEKLLLGCIDGSIILFDQSRGVTQLIKAAFIPSLLSWHIDRALIVVANEKCQIQCFDISLACMKTQIISEESNPNNILDLSTYFRNHPTLTQMYWNKKIDVQHSCSRFLQNDSLLILVFEKGPLATFRLFSSAGLKGDVHTSGLTTDNLVYSYISVNQIDRAVNILLNLNWDINGISCLMSLQRIVNHLFKQKLTPEIENQIQKTLGSFYSPTNAISSSILTEFGDQVKDIARKFFHLLVRYRLFEKAFCLAIDINDYDLFMDLYYYAQTLKDDELANASLNKAKELINSNDCSHSTCSRSSCSQCSEDSYSNEDNNIRDWNNQNNDVPPLPITPKIQNFSTYTPPLPKINKNFVPFQNIVPVSTPQVPNTRFFQPNLTKIPITNTNFIKPHNLEFNPYRNLNSYSQNLRSNYITSNLESSIGQVFRPLAGNNNVFGGQSREIVHRTISFNIPPPPSITNTVKKTNNGPYTVNSNSVKMNLPGQSGINKNNGEKNVKFSDTVTAFIVPEIPRTEKPKEKPKRPANVYVTDPKRELADSLPLCHPNEDYLKDFTPISNTQEGEEKKATKIQVVHFGMV